MTYAQAMAKYAITDDDKRIYEELERKDVFGCLNMLVGWYTDEHKCDVPFDGDDVERIIDESIEYVRNSDYASIQIEAVRMASEKLFGIEI